MSAIRPAEFPGDLGAIRSLFQEYAASLEISLDFQGFDEELETLPADYAPPSGRLLLACADGHPVGCIALRRFDDDIGEMKRLFLRPQARGCALGRDLVVRLCQEARQAGYSRIRLDTLPTMNS